jgi:pSer/pThr/pTyr-binding forkhead associated (FHA) protein
MDFSFELIDHQGRRIPLTGAELIAGRNPECAIRLADTQASRRHFSLRSTPTGWQISDLGSSNGTFVNERRLPPGAQPILAPGDRIRAGAATFVVQEARSVAPDRPRQVEDSSRPPRQAHSPGVPDLSGAARPAWRWAVLGVGMAAVVLLLAGVYSPWLRLDLPGLPEAAKLPASGVAGEAVKLLGGLAQKLTGAAGSAGAALPLPTPSGVLQQTITGLDAHSYGLLLIIVAILAAAALAADLILLSPGHPAFGAVYLLLGLAPGLMLLVDYARFDRLARQPMLFGLDMMTLFKATNPFLDLQVQPMTGLYLVGAGLALLLLTGVLRIAAPLLRSTTHHNERI